MPPLLEVGDLVVSYGASLALSGLSICVPDRSVVGLLGANGAGKSTLLSAIAGLVHPSSGFIRHRGERIDGMHAHDVAARGITLIPEGRGIFPALTVAENLRVALGDDDDRHHRVFERYPILRERRGQLASTLSGGEQQMLALARAIAVDGLLMVDEPSLGLAPKLVAEIGRTLRELHAEGRTVLLVEQYAAQVLRLADFVYIVGRGTIVWAGEPAELRASKVLAKSYLGAEA